MNTCIHDEAYLRAILQLAGLSRVHSRFYVIHNALIGENYTLVD